MCLSDWGAIGSIVGGVAGVISIIITIAINRNVKTIEANGELSNKKDNLRLEVAQIYYGEQAKQKYEQIKSQLPDVYPYIWGPNEWEGEQDRELLEIFDVDYDNDKDKMGIEWKNCTKGIKYVYKDGMKWFSRGWRI